MAHLDRPAAAAPRGSHAPHPPVRYSTPALSDKRLAPTQRPDFAQAVVALAQANGKAAVMINDDAQLAHAVGAQGLHLSSSRLWEIDQRPDFERIAASCHRAADLARAAQLSLDVVVLGPVLPTASHPRSNGIGGTEFSRWWCSIPLFLSAPRSYRLQESANAGWFESFPDSPQSLVNLLRISRDRDR